MIYNTPVQNVPIKSAKEIQIMREGGRIHADIVQELKSMVKPGLLVWDLEEKFLELCSKYNVLPACKGYAPWGMPPFPTGLCISINDQGVHGIPKKGVKVVEGDLLTIDSNIKHQNMFLDHAITVGVGKISEENQHLLDTAYKALDVAISKVKPGIRMGIISNAIQTIAESAGYSVLTMYAGHGIGKAMHELPEIPCFGKKTDGVVLQEGMTLAIEPLIAEGSEYLVHKSHWESVTADGGNFVQVEHTVLVTATGHEILTLPTQN